MQLLLPPVGRIDLQKHTVKFVTMGFTAIQDIARNSQTRAKENCLVNGRTIINTTAGHHFEPGGSCTGTGGALALLVSDFLCCETAVVFTQTGSGQKSLKDCTFSAGVLTAQIVCPTPLKQSTTLTGDLFEHLPYGCLGSSIQSAFAFLAKVLAYAN